MVIAELIIVAVVALIVLLTVVRSVRIIPQARARNVERFGRYRKTLEPGLNFIVPFVDRVKTQIDLREQVVSFDSQPVITEDNLVVADRHGAVLPGDRPEGGGLRDRQLHSGDRAAHGHHAAVGHRLDGPRADADLP